MKIELYSDIRDKSPVQDFIQDLDPKMKAKTLRMIDLLEEKGDRLCEPYSKCLEHGIYELRIQQSSNICRVLYFFCVGNVAVLTNGFIKKTQKTPKKEITTALKYKTDYERRH